jgi:hypothetical protein
MGREKGQRGKAKLRGKKPTAKRLARMTCPLKNDQMAKSRTILLRDKKIN